MKPSVLVLISLSLTSVSALAIESKSPQTVIAKPVFTKSIPEEAKIYDGSISAPIADKGADQAKIAEPTEEPRRTSPPHRY